MTSEAHLEHRTHDDYTMGWVCALPKEQTAAIAMLDHRHADLQKPPNDPNTYTLGSINSHNIVIAYPPKGKTEPKPAATAAAWMVSTFSSIKVSLLVGIGSGVPPKVRLGDVVVSMPIGQFPSVIQWDFGKAKEGGKFERTGSLNNPPTPLLTALTRLETEHDLNGSKIPEYLDQLKGKWPRLASKYLRSDRHEDLLFKSDYQHIGENANYENSSGFEDSAEEEYCKFCDKSQVIKKKPRDIRAHYGLIASGNQVIKDAVLRNKLNKDLDNHVLCIEMEAAGLMNNFPCIVIRGICDYADSHKNNAWQDHAAATAAAFAKELLGYIQTSEIEKERPAKDVLGKVHNTISAIKEDTAHTRDKPQGIENISFFDWLTPTDYGLQQSDYFMQWQPGTGRWLLDSKEFQSWFAAGNQTLLLLGIPGAGKTILTSIVVNHLVSEFRYGDVGISYIYCNFHRHDEQSTGNLLASILKQLAKTLPLLPESVKNLYKKHQSRRTRPSVDELYKNLRSVIALYSRVFIIVDALDELPTLNDNRVKFLFQLFNLQIESGINIFATSRPIPEIYEKFKGSMMLEARAHNDDVRDYLDHQISESGLRILDICREDIKTKITEAVDGMFILARLYFEVVKNKRTVKKIKDALKDLPNGHNAYDYVYEEAMKRIISQDPDAAELARQVLSWIVCAKRPLKVLELQHALALEHEKDSIDGENLLPIGDIAAICAGLVTIEEESGIIRLIHYTTLEYLERTRERWFPDAEDIITTKCATYLLLNEFKSGPCETDSDLEKRLRVFHFYDYAAHNWGNHARACITLIDEVMRFLVSKLNIEASAQVLMVGDRPWNDSQDYPRHMTGLHLAAYFGVEKAAIGILQRENHVDLGDSFGRTPLSYAAENGHEALVKLLLATGKVYTNSPDKYNRNPLSYAAKNGHEDVVKLLLMTNAGYVNLPDKDNRTPLSYAAENGHRDVVKLLLITNAVSVNLPDQDNRTPLSYAAENGHRDVVELLLASSEISITSLDKYDRNPLSYAAENGYENVVKLLLAIGEFDIDLSDKYDRTPLFYAAQNDHEALVELFLDRGVNIEIKDRNGRSLLSWAAENKHKATARLLLDTNQSDAPEALLADTSQFSSGDSDVESDNGSILSIASIPYSTTTLGVEMERIHMVFIQKFVTLLKEDTSLRFLTLDAISKQDIGFGRAQNNFRRLLKYFAGDLRVETVSNHHRELVGFVKKNLSTISQEFFIEFSRDDQKAVDKIPELKVQQDAADENQKRVEEYLAGTESVEQATPTHLNNSTLDNDADEQIELSESDGESDQDGIDEEPEPEELHNDLLRHLDELRQFILESTAYQTLRRRYDEFVRPSLRSRLGDLLTKWSKHNHRYHSFVARYKLSNLVAELQYIHPQEIRLDENNQSNHLHAFWGYCQSRVEHWTQEPWEWWPLPPYLRHLEQWESRIRWQCICGEERWAEVPQPFARRLMTIIRDLSKDGVSMSGIESPSASHLRNTSAHGASENAFSPTVPSKSGEAHQPLQRAFPINPPLGRLVDTQASADTTTPNHRVLFAVNRGTEYKLAQIHVSKHSCQSFFHELRGQYFHLRGHLRGYFSVWRYHHCDFYDFEKFADHAFTPVNKDAFPELGNSDYDYQPRPMNQKPPVHTHEFAYHFYARRKRNINILVQPHSELLDRLPKKLTEFEEGGDKREIFWGIYARESISIRWVLFYNFLCLLPMMGFFIIWISPLGHGTDLQNPSIPISMMISMLSLFWSIFLSSLPFGRAH